MTCQYKKSRSNKVKVDEKSYINVFIYYIGYVIVKNLGWAKINSVNLLYLIINKTNGYIVESKGNKSFILIPADESKDTLKNYDEL